MMKMTMIMMMLMMKHQPGCDAVTVYRHHVPTAGSSSLSQSREVAVMIGNQHREDLLLGRYLLTLTAR